jgi:hypothetical protein
LTIRKITDIRVLSIAPSTWGFGFALLDGNRLVICGVKKIQVKGDENRNRECLKRLGDLIDRWQPRILTIEDANAKESRRRPRIRALVTQIAGMAASRKLNIALLSRRKMMHNFFDCKRVKKYRLAKHLAECYPEELGHRLPPERREWESERFSMDMFDAVAFGMMVHRTLHGFPHERTK